MERSNDSRRADASQADVEADESEVEESGSLQFSSSGALPPVAEPVELAALTPSERAYGRAGNDQDEGDELSAEGRIMQRISRTDGATIDEASRRYAVPEVDILAVITKESRGVATANAGATQRDRGRNAASGLMQVTRETWLNTQRNHSELSRYSFDSHRYDRRANILVGTAALADKRVALERLGVPANNGNSTVLTTMAFNAGEGVVAAAYEHAEDAGSSQPGVDCLKREHLVPAIAQYPSVYSYYLTGGGKGRNPQRTRDRAIELKFLEISRYPGHVMELIAEAREHGLADGAFDADVLPSNPTMLASNEDNEKQPA